MLEHVIRYVIGTEYYGILLPNRIDGVQILCWKDEDWDRNLLNGRSRTGVLFPLYGGPVIWKSKLQTSTTT